MQSKWEKRSLMKILAKFSLQTLDWLFLYEFNQNEHPFVEKWQKQDVPKKREISSTGKAATLESRGIKMSIHCSPVNNRRSNQGNNCKEWTTSTETTSSSPELKWEFPSCITWTLILFSTRDSKNNNRKKTRVSPQKSGNRFRESSPAQRKTLENKGRRHE